MLKSAIWGGTPMAKACVIWAEEANMLHIFLSNVDQYRIKMHSNLRQNAVDELIVDALVGNRIAAGKQADNFIVHSVYCRKELVFKRLLGR